MATVADLSISTREYILLLCHGLTALLRKCSPSSEHEQALRPHIFACVRRITRSLTQSTTTSSSSTNVVCTLETLDHTICRLDTMLSRLKQPVPSMMSSAMSRKMALFWNGVTSQTPQRRLPERTCSPLGLQPHVPMPRSPSPDSPRRTLNLLQVSTI